MNKNVFISGASRGIGRAIAYHFAKNNFVVVGTSRNEFEFDQKNENLIPIKLDVTSRDDVTECFEMLKSKDLLPKILINNAGITSDQIFLRMKNEDWDNVINTNLNGVFNLSKINYSSSKAALNGFTKSLAKELGSRNITVNCIAPGFIETDMTSYINENEKNKLLNSIPLKRLGKAEDVAKLVSFLASNKASYITGQTISIDGGLLMN